MPERIRYLQGLNWHGVTETETPGCRFLVLACVAAFCLIVAGDLMAADAVREGGRIARDVARGNCLACHRVPGDPEAVTSADIGPPLLAMGSRFPEREKLRAQIWDATSANPDTVMPPFGRNKILSADDIELIVEYLYALGEGGAR